MLDIKLGISSCPNDTYIFAALLNNLIPTEDIKFHRTIDDVEALNMLALSGSLDITKVSFGVYPQIADRYSILSAGAALGFNVGPVIVATSKIESISSLKGKKIAIPGNHTTANLLLDLFYKDLVFEKIEMRFDKIITSILNGDVDAGILIHEGRFIYSKHGLKLLSDLGELYYSEFKMPLPLGFIAIKKEIVYLAGTINKLIQSSIDYAKNNYSKISNFIEAYAENLDKDLIRSHIDLYVNEYSYDLRIAACAVNKLLGIKKEDIV